jgi:hypothetical protein
MFWLLVFLQDDVVWEGGHVNTHDAEAKTANLLANLLAAPVSSGQSPGLNPEVQSVEQGKECKQQ